MDNELIVVKQLPIIEDQLREVKAKIEARVALALSLACTEETYKDVKRERASLSKEFASLEARRKEVKEAILAPYQKFEQLYKECAGDIYSEADRQLKKKIEAVESGLKKEKRDELVSFFDEYRLSKGIDADVVHFEDLGIVVTMSDSKKKLHANVTDLLDKIADDLACIGTMENKDEVLVEYKTFKNLSKAAFIVASRHRAIEEEAKKREAARIAAEAKAAAEHEVVVAAEEYAEPPIEAPISVPTQAPIPQEQEEKRYSVAFVVEGTIEQLKELKAFLTNGCYTWNTIK